MRDEDLPVGIPVGPGDYSLEILTGFFWCTNGPNERAREDAVSLLGYLHERGYEITQRQEQMT